MKNKTKRIIIVRCAQLMLIASAILLISLPLISESHGAESTVFASDHLSVSALRYNDITLEGGRHDRLNVRPYGVSLSDTANLGGSVYEDKVVYTQRLTFNYYINSYTSALIDDTFDFSTYTFVDTYVETHRRPNFAATWEHDLFEYQFRQLDWTVKNTHNYDGMIYVGLNFNSELITYNDSVISDLDMQFKTVKPGDFESGVVGDYENIIFGDFYDPGFSSAGYDTSADFDAIEDTGGDAANDVSNYLNNPNNCRVTPLETINRTLQNYVAEPLIPTQQVTVTKNEVNRLEYRFPLRIRPEISVIYRDISVRAVDLWYDTSCTLGTCGIIYGSTRSSDVIEAPTQYMALDVNNQFVNQKFEAVAYVTADVPKAYFEEQQVDFTDPTILQGDWVWDATGIVGSGTQTIGGASPTGLALGLIILSVIAVVILIYFRQQLAAYFAGRRRGRQQANKGRSKNNFFKNLFGGK